MISFSRQISCRGRISFLKQRSWNCVNLTEQGMQYWALFAGSIEPIVAFPILANFLFRVHPRCSAPQAALKGVLREKRVLEWHLLRNHQWDADSRTSLSLRNHFAHAYTVKFTSIECPVVCDVYHCVNSFQQLLVVQLFKKVSTVHGSEAFISVLTKVLIRLCPELGVNTEQHHLSN